jgi:hypothetical protein
MDVYNEKIIYKRLEAIFMNDKNVEPLDDSNSYFLYAKESMVKYYLRLAFFTTMAAGLWNIITNQSYNKAELI